MDENHFSNTNALYPSLTIIVLASNDSLSLFELQIEASTVCCGPTASDIRTVIIFQCCNCGETRSDVLERFHPSMSTPPIIAFNHETPTFHQNEVAQVSFIFSSKHHPMHCNSEHVLKLLLSQKTHDFTSIYVQCTHTHRFFELGADIHDICWKALLRVLVKKGSRQNFWTWMTWVVSCCLAGYLSVRSVSSVRSWKKNGQEGVGGFGRLEGYRPASRRPTLSSFPHQLVELDHPASKGTPAKFSVVFVYEHL